MSFNGSGKSVTAAILCYGKSITAAILCSGKSVTAAILCSGKSVTAAVLWDRVPAFLGMSIGSAYTSGRYVSLVASISARIMFTPVFCSYHSSMADLVPLCTQHHLFFIFLESVYYFTLTGTNSKF